MKTAMTQIATTVLGMVVTLGGCKSGDHSDHDHAAKHDHAVKQDHSGHAATSDHSGATATTVPAAQNYADAIAQIRAHMTSLDTILKSGDYDAVHKDSVAIGTLGKSLGALATASNSPVPKGKVTDVTAAGTELAAASRSFHTAAHEPDLPKVKEHYAHMGQLVESLARYAATP